MSNLKEMILNGEQIDRNEQEELVWETDFEIVEEEIEEQTRWNTVVSRVIKIDNRFFAYYFLKAATEYQEDDFDMVEPIEVFPTEVKVIKYLTKDALSKF